MGGGTAIYSIIDSVLFGASNDPSLARVVNIYNADPRLRNGNFQSFSLSLSDFEALRETQRTLATLTAWTPARAVLRTDSGTESILGEAVIGDYFETLSVVPVQGRLLSASDHAAEAAPTAVIGFGLWQKHFAGRRDAIGATIYLDGLPFTVVGVVPSSFRGSFMAEVVPTSVWISIRHKTQLSPTDRESTRLAKDELRLLVRGSIRLSVTLDQVEADLERIGAALDSTNPIIAPVGSRRNAGRQWTAVAATDVSLHGQGTRIVRPVAIATMGLIALALLVASANIANLVIARGLERTREFTVALALGATRARLVREQLCEYGVLALLGGIGGVILAAGIFSPLLRTKLELSNGILVQVEPRLAWTAVGVALLLTLLPFLIFGLIPAVITTRSSLLTAPSSVPVVTSRRTGVTDWLMIAQVVASTVLVTLALWTWQGARRQAADLTAGMDTAGLALVHLRIGDESRINRATSRALLESANTSAAIDRSAIIATLPFGQGQSRGRVSRSETGGAPLTVAMLTGTDQMLSVLGLRVLKGLAPTDREELLGPSPVWLSQKSAQLLFPDGIAIGRTVRIDVDGSGPSSNPAAVVGIVEDRALEPLSSTQGNAYLLLQTPLPPDPYLIVRSSVKAPTLLRHLSAHLRSTRADAEVVTSMTVDELISRDTRPLRIASNLLALLGSLSLSLTAVGLVGMLMHLVASSRREMAIRLALGCSPRRLVAAVVSRGIVPVLVGLFVGVPIALGCLKLIAQPIAQFRTVGIGPLVADIVLFMLAVAVSACWIPARVAAKVNPAVILSEP